MSTFIDNEDDRLRFDHTLAEESTGVIWTSLSAIDELTLGVINDSFDGFDDQRVFMLSSFSAVLMWVGIAITVCLDIELVDEST